MPVSFQFILQQAMKGDILANEVVRLVMSATAHGLETKILVSTNGKSITVKYCS